MQRWRTLRRLAAMKTRPQATVSLLKRTHSVVRKLQQQTMRSPCLLSEVTSLDNLYLCTPAEPPLHQQRPTARCEEDKQQTMTMQHLRQNP